MTRDHQMFVIWALAIVGAATAVILYQHAIHTSAIVASVMSTPAQALGAQPGGAGVSGAISANPINTGASSRASGQWGPLGPDMSSIMPYMPAQANQ